MSRGISKKTMKRLFDWYDIITSKLKENPKEEIWAGNDRCSFAIRPMDKGFRIFRLKVRTSPEDRAVSLHYTGELPKQYVEGGYRYVYFGDAETVESVCAYMFYTAYKSNVAIPVNWREVWKNEQKN